MDDVSKNELTTAENIESLSHKKKGVHVVLFTENGFGRPDFLTSSEVTDFENEYPTLQIKGQWRRGDATFAMTVIV